MLDTRRIPLEHQSPGPLDRSPTRAPLIAFRWKQRNRLLGGNEKLLVPRPPVRGQVRLLATKRGFAPIAVRWVAACWSPGARQSASASLRGIFDHRNQKKLSMLVEIFAPVCAPPMPRALEVAAGPAVSTQK